MTKEEKTILERLDLKVDGIITMLQGEDGNGGMRQELTVLSTEHKNCMENQNKKETTISNIVTWIISLIALIIAWWSGKS